MAIVPDVVGLQKDVAIAAIVAAGLVAESTSVKSGSKINNHGVVQSQLPTFERDPDTGQPIPKTVADGSVVNINVFEVPSQQVLRKIVIPLEKLPYMTADGKYYLRYRVRSESGVSTSEWSPVSTLTGKKISDILLENGVSSVPITVTSDDFSIFVNWEIPSILKNITFDGHVRWSADGTTWTDWEFVTTTTANNFSVKIPEEYRTSDISDPNYVMLWIQLPTKVKEISEYAKLVVSDATSTKPEVVDGGIIVHIA